MRSTARPTRPRPANRQKSLKIFLPLAARSRYPCAWKMAYFSTASASERRNLTGKNRVWDFFRLSNETHPANRRQPLQPRRKIRPTPTKTVSGIPLWPSRDPIGERGGHRLYAFVENCPTGHIDINGLWAEKTHRIKTTEWGIQSNVPKLTSEIVGISDNDVDTQFSPTSPSEENWSWHFDRSTDGKDTRRAHYDEELALAKKKCNFTDFGNDDAYGAARRLGRGLHALQDIYAHSDYNRKSEVPSIGQMWLGGVLWYIHNYIAPYRGSTSDPDDPDKDAETPSGYSEFIYSQYLGSPGFGSSNVVIGHRYREGHVRIAKTELVTKQAYLDMRTFVAEKSGNTNGHCACRVAFGVPIK